MNYRVLDLTGKKFGRLTVLKYTDKRAGSNVIWECVCDCGNLHNVAGKVLTSGGTRSCGCYKRDRAIETNLTHGMSRGNKVTRIYKCWSGIIDRCNPRTDSKNYSNRGIDVCDEWKDFTTFMDWSYENGYTDKLTIDRIDNDGNYSPSNCRWVDMKIQGRNRRTNREITIDGVTKCVTEWCEVYGIHYETARSRLNNGWGELESFATPPFEKGNNRERQKRKEVKN